MHVNGSLTVPLGCVIVSVAPDGPSSFLTPPEQLMRVVTPFEMNRAGNFGFGHTVPLIRRVAPTLMLVPVTCRTNRPPLTRTRRQAVIVAHPADAAELRRGLIGLGELLDSIGIEEDARLGRGQLRVETELGVIEADLRGQLERLAGQLKKLLESHGTESV